MAYRTLAWVVSLICGLAISAGAATLGEGFFDQPIFPPHAYEQLVNLRAKTRGVIARNSVAKDAGQESGRLSATTANSKVGGIIVVDNALLVSVKGNALLGNGLGNSNNYNKTTVAGVKDSFNKFTGVVNLNVASGNLNSQSASYSGPDLSSSGLANGGSTRVAAVRR